MNIINFQNSFQKYEYNVLRTLEKNYHIYAKYGYYFEPVEQEDISTYFYSFKKTWVFRKIIVILTKL